MNNAVLIRSTASCRHYHTYICPQELLPAQVSALRKKNISEKK
jgi:hypothetical protein